MAKLRPTHLQSLQEIKEPVKNFAMSLDPVVIRDAVRNMV